MTPLYIFKVQSYQTDHTLYLKERLISNNKYCNWSQLHVCLFYVVNNIIVCAFLPPSVRVTVAELCLPSSSPVESGGGGRERDTKKDSRPSKRLSEAILTLTELRISPGAKVTLVLV